MNHLEWLTPTSPSPQGAGIDFITYLKVMRLPTLSNSPGLQAQRRVREKIKPLSYKDKALALRGYHFRPNFLGSSNIAFLAYLTMKFKVITFSNIENYSFTSTGRRRRPLRRFLTLSPQGDQNRPKIYHKSDRKLKQPILDFLTTLQHFFMFFNAQPEPKWLPKST